ncbi:hypothetical protein [Streptomyces sp. NPDC002845]
MPVTRAALTSLATATLLAATPATAAAPEADLAYHGRISLSAGHIVVRLTPGNHGPTPVTDATVRLHWSAPLADRQHLPEACARAGARTVACGTGELPADGLGREIRLRVRLKGTPSEVEMEISTLWSSGDSVDRNRQNDRRRVLALDTGDAYVF